TADKAAWRDPRVSEAYTAATIASDPIASRRDPPSVRVPAGPLRDSYLLAGGARMWDAGAIRAATLFVRGSLDHWSRPEDSAAPRARPCPPGRDRRAPRRDALRVPRSPRAWPRAADRDAARVSQTTVTRMPSPRAAFASSSSAHQNATAMFSDCNRSAHDSWM